MARVTVEDCIDKVESPYELVLVAKERTTQLNSGSEPTVSIDNDKNTVISLREIANENIKVEELKVSAVYKLRKHVEQIDDSSEEDEEVGCILGAQMFKCSIAHRECTSGTVCLDASGSAPWGVWMHKGSRVCM